MKILITGAAGFVGTNLKEQLTNKYELLVPTQGELELLNEQAVEAYFKKHCPNVVIHCANVGATRRTDNLPQIVGNNLRMFLNLSRQEKYFKKMIFFGSGAEFDKREPLEKVGEDYVSKNLPDNDYGLSKYLCSHFIRESDKIINLRIFGVYGRHDDYQNRFVSNAVCRAVLGLPIVIFKDQLMDFIFVDDLIKIVSYFIEKEPKNKFFNIGTGTPYRLTQIAETIKKISGKDLEIRVQNLGEANEYSCNNSRLIKELKNFEFTSLEVSLQKLYGWYEANQNLIDRSKF